MFQQHTRLSFDTFHALIKVVNPGLEWKNTNMRKNFPLEARVVLPLTKLGSGNSLQMCVEVHGIAKSTASIIVGEFCVIIRNHLEPLVIHNFFLKLKKLPLVLNAYMEFLTS